MSGQLGLSTLSLIPACAVPRRLGILGVARAVERQRHTITFDTPARLSKVAFYNIKLLYMTKCLYMGANLDYL